MKEKQEFGFLSQGYAPPRAESVAMSNEGYYLVDEDIAFFDKKPVAYNKTQRLKAKNIYYDRTIGFAKAVDKVDMIDTTYKMIFRGDYVEVWEKKGVSYATDSAYFINYDGGDSPPNPS